MDQLLLNATEVSELLGLGRSTVYAMMASGDLPVIRIGRAIRVSRAGLEAWVESRTADACARGDERQTGGAIANADRGARR